MPRFVEVTIMQTETFTFKMEVPDGATRSEVHDLAENFRKADNILEAARENSDCNTHLYNIEAVEVDAGSYVCFLDEDGMVDWKTVK